MKIHLFIILALLLIRSADADERAFSLLKAAFDARNCPDNLWVQFSITHNGSSNGQTIGGGLFSRPATCELLFLGSRRLTKVLTETEKEIIWFDGKHGWHWCQGEHTDLVRNSKKYLDDKGLFYFSLPTIGTTFMNSPNIDFSPKLKARNFKLQSPQAVNNTQCEVIEVTGGPFIEDGSMIHYFIEEPTLRIHKVTCTGESKVFKRQYNEEVISTFSVRSNTSHSLTWLPETVTAKGTIYPNWIISDIRVIGRKLQEEDFSIKAADIPVGTAVVDYDLKRRLGYWTGSEIDENFVYTGEPPWTMGWLWWLSIAAGLGAIGYLGFAWYRRR